MNRFLINLRSLDHSGISSSAAQQFSRFSVLSFRVSDSILGNIGQSLNHGVAPDDASDDVDISNDTARVAQDDSVLSSVLWLHPEPDQPK
jgi:hypothetical protein